jgi:tetratricopeptide (TPR) repeat protein
MNEKAAEGITVLEKVVAKPGYKNTNGFTNLGYAYRNAEPVQAEKSATAYQKALELDPKNAQAALGLGWATTMAQKYDAAIPSFAKAVELDPKLAGEAHNGTAWDYYFKKDMVKAREFANKAKAEGRNVDKLLKTIDDFEKGLARAEDAQKQLQENQRIQAQADTGVDGAARRIMRGSPADRRAAAAEMARYGKPATQYLIYAVYNDKDFGVRTAALQSLGSIGDKSVCDEVRRLAGNNPYEKTIMTPEEQRLFVAYEDLRKVMRATLAKLGC